jgi:hypothetical protein
MKLNPRLIVFLAIALWCVAFWVAFWVIVVIGLANLLGW